jgi:stage II sporulation protein D
VTLRRALASIHTLLIVSGAALASAVGVLGSTGVRAEPAENAVATSAQRPRSVRVRVGNRVVSTPLEDYVLGSALTEVSPVGESPEVVARIFEVQAVLARSYAVANAGRHRSEGFDLCDGTHCQLYQPTRLATSRFTEAARAAVAATRGRVLTYGARVARVTFHADCGGYTADAAAVWQGGPVAYLIAAVDDAPDVEHREWTFSAPSEDLRRALNRARDTSVGARLSDIVVTARDSSGRATRVDVRGSQRRTLSGERLRAVVNAAFGPKALQSTRFDVVAAERGYRFEGTGYGHGVGLCQVGAAARARQGDSLIAILATYFPGARLS